MNPVEAIVWVGVIVFAATSLLAVLYLAGLAPKLREEHGKHLFKILITEIVASSVGVFAFFISEEVRSNDKIHIPVADLMLFEQSDIPKAVYDGDLVIYIRSTDVSRNRRTTELLIDTRIDFSTSKRLDVEPGIPVTALIGERKYRFSYKHMGTLDADPKEKQGRNLDFILMSIIKTN